MSSVRGRLARPARDSDLEVNDLVEGDAASGSKFRHVRKKDRDLPPRCRISSDSLELGGEDGAFGKDVEVTKHLADGDAVLLDSLDQLRARQPAHK
eukprot:2524210-Pleurochrysis_carterae.AAC.2